MTSLVSFSDDSIVAHTIISGGSDEALAPPMHDRQPREVRLASYSPPRPTRRVVLSPPTAPSASPPPSMITAPRRVSDAATPLTFGSRDEVLKYIKTRLQPLYDRGAVNKPQFVTLTKSTLQFVMRHPAGSEMWRSTAVDGLLEVQLKIVLEQNEKGGAAGPAAAAAAATVSAEMTKNMVSEAPQQAVATFADHRTALRGIKERLATSAGGVAASVPSVVRNNLGATSRSSSTASGGSVSDVPVFVDPHGPRHASEYRAAVNIRTRDAMDSYFLTPARVQNQHPAATGRRREDPPNVDRFLIHMEQKQSMLLAESSERALLQQQESNGFLFIATMEGNQRAALPKAPHFQRPALSTPIAPSPQPPPPTTPPPHQSLSASTGQAATLNRVSFDVVPNFGREQSAHLDADTESILRELEEEHAMIDEMVQRVQKKGEAVQMMLQARRTQQQFTPRAQSEQPPPQVAASALRQQLQTAASPHRSHQAASQLHETPSSRRSALSHFTRETGHSDALAAQRIMQAISPRPGTPSRTLGPARTSAASPAALRNQKHSPTPRKRGGSDAISAVAPAGPSRLQVVEHIRTVLQPAYDQGALPKAKFAEVVRAVSTLFFSRQWRTGSVEADAEWKAFLEDKLVEVVSRRQ